MAKSARKQGKRQPSKKTGEQASNQTIKAIGKSAFTDLVRTVQATKRKLKEETTAISGKIDAAVEHNRLHRGAFNLFIRLSGMDPLKRAEFLFHFDTYRRYGELDDAAGFYRRGGEAEPNDEVEQPTAAPEGERADEGELAKVGRGDEARSSFSRALHGGDRAQLGPVGVDTGDTPATSTH
jgi:hypothetical protein